MSRNRGAHMDGLEILTFMGAAVAALSSSLGVWWQWKDREDRLILKHGPLSPKFYSGEFLYVVNRSKHNVTVRDYGFILESGEVFSLPEVEKDWGHEEGDGFFDLLGELEPGANQEAGASYVGGRVIAVFAITSTASRPQLTFRQRSPYFEGFSWKTRLQIRWHAAIGGMEALHAWSYEYMAKNPFRHKLPAMPPVPPTPPV